MMDNGGNGAQDNLKSTILVTVDGFKKEVVAAAHENLHLA